MAKKTAVVDVQVKSSKTLAQLEDELAQINAELKDLDINSQAFTDLAKKAQLADGQIREINTSLEGVTSAQRSDSVKKLSEGLVGGFAAAASASVLFGDKSSEAMQKAIQKAGALFVAADGIDKIFKAMEKSNIKALKATVAGFAKSAKAAKAFALTTKGALISTGIGALVILVGLIIANFDKLKAAVQKNADKIKESLKFISPPLYAIIRLVEVIKEKFGDLQNFIAGVGAAIKSALTFDGKGFKGVKEAFNETVELEKEADAIREDYNKKVTETQKLYEQNLEILKEQGATQEEINEEIRKRLELERDEIVKLDNIGKATKEQKERLEEITHQITLQGIREENLVKQRREELSAAKEKLATELLATQTKIEASAKEAQAAAKAEEDATKALELQRIADRFQLRYLQYSKNIQNIETQIYDQKVRQRPLLEFAALNAQQIVDLNAEILGYNEDLLRLDEEKQKVEEKTYLFASQKEKQLFNIASNRAQLHQRIQEVKEGILDSLSAENQGLIEVSVLEIKLLELDKKRLQAKETERKESLKFAKENGASVAEILTIENDLRQIEVDRVKLQDDINQAQTKQTILIARAVDEAVKFEETTKTGLQNLQDWTEEWGGNIAEFTNTYIAPLAAEFNNLLSAQADLFAANEEAKIAAWEKDIERQEELYEAAMELEEEKQDLIDEGGDRILDLEDLLKDANAERYSEIQTEINKEKASLAQLEIDKAIAAENAKNANNEILRQKYLIAVAEWEIQKSDAKTARIQAGIDAALAIINALGAPFPLNLVLPAIIAIAAGTQIAAISKRLNTLEGNAPPEPKYAAEGGLLQGASHAAGGIPVEAEGGEYIVNKKSTSQFLPLIEAINEKGRPKFADGGQVPQLHAGEGAAGLDYDLLAAKIKEGIQPVVSVVEITDRQNRVRVIESNAAI